MAILETEVLVGVLGKASNKYENLGYYIPREKDIYGRLRVARGTKILVKVEDLSEKSNEKVTRICDDCGRKKIMCYYLILDGRKKKNNLDMCLKCTSIANGEKRRVCDEYEKSLEYYAVHKNMKHLLNEYSKKNKLNIENVFAKSGIPILWNCLKCGEEYKVSPAIRTSSDTVCPCSKIIALTNPQLHQMMLNKEDGYKYTEGSNKKISWKCLGCGEIIKNKVISMVNISGLSCPKCSDGKPLPEKMIYNLLKSLNIDFEWESSFCWAKDKRYDFYIQETETIIEVHGRQHYEQTNRRGARTLQEEQENDRYKYKMAMKNGIRKYIVIDARKSDIAFLTSSIKKSSLTELIDLNAVDWAKIYADSNKSLLILVSECWNKGIYNITEISKLTKLSRWCVTIYLKRARSVGICDYDKSTTFSNRSKKMVVKMDKSGAFVEEFDSVKSASESVNLKPHTISSCLNGTTKTSGGFKWMYKEDYEKLMAEQDKSDSIAI